MRRRSRAGGEPVKTRRRKTVTLKRRNATKSVHGRSSSVAVFQEQLDRRTHELSEALEQQKATAEILRVIRTSPADVQPVFETIVRNAVSLCGSVYAHVFRFDGELLHLVASHNVAPSPWRHYADYLKAKYPMRPDSSQVSGRVLLKKSVVRLEDALADPDYDQRSAQGGWRRVLGVPMLREGEPLGVIVVGWTEAGPVPKVQEELLKTFADQAVIAIENVRLFEAEQQRTRELSESLEQQTATADVLRVISSSPGELEPVFEAMLAKATHLCEAKFGALYLFEGGSFRVVAVHGSAPPSFVEARRQYPVLPATPGTSLGRVAATKQTVQIPDAQAEPAYRITTAASVGLETGGLRTVLSVPMLKEGELVGTFNLFRQEVRPFTDKQIEVVTNFAAQAVIAIENARLLNELRQSLEQQTATSDVLRVISSSPGELELVFQTMLENATRLCEARFGALGLCEGDAFRIGALHNAPPAFADFVRRGSFRPGPNVPVGRALRTKQVIHVADMTAEQAYIEGDPLFVTAVEVGGYRTVLHVPMLKEEQLVGVITIYRQEVRPFTDKQIDLLTNFAAQAVIAIENTRLLNELRQRTDDLSESLDQQTATSEVLSVISSSPGELEPVFKAMLENATRICEARYGTMWLCEGDAFRAAALHGPLPQAYIDLLRSGTLFHFGSDTPTARVVQTRQPVQIPDLSETRAYLDRDPVPVAAVEVAGIRTMFSVPMFKEDQLVGTISIYRQEMLPFTDKQIELVKNFAAQAVIAIENARLLNELRESLDRQTATADVLRVISSSPGELEPVFKAILENATRICEANFGQLQLYENGAFRIGAMHNVPPAWAKIRQREPLIRPGPLTPLTQMVATKQLVHIANYNEHPAYQQGDPGAVRFVEVAGVRTLVLVPMLKEEELIGTIQVYRQEVRPFTDKQLQLLENFAAQAVIAIENARLLNELRQSLQQQTATADVLKVISRSTFDLQTVLDTLVRSARDLCDADMAAMHRQQGTKYQAIATYGSAAEHRELRIPFEAGRGTVLGRTLLERRPVQVLDVVADPDYSLQEVQKKFGFRTVLAVPMLREGNPVGAIVLMRLIVQPFTDKQIELAQTFADQAGIAIENVRLFDEIQDKSRQLEEASQHKSQFLANMSHELRTPLNAILGYSELMADGAYGEPSEKMLGILKRLEANGKHLLGLINDVLDLSKIEAGQLVLELSDYSVQDIAQTVRSTLEPLAADKKLAFKLELAPELPAGHGDGRRLTQVLINLVGNAIKFTDAGEVAIKAEANNGAFYVSVRDTGPGISAADQARLFQEFQQADNAITRKKGGTGLGLAISKRIIEMHGGEIWVESQPGHGSIFAFTLPVIVEQQVNVESD
jgi:GAF domain-containing protein